MSARKATGNAKEKKNMVTEKVLQQAREIVEEEAKKYFKPELNKPEHRERAMSVGILLLHRLHIALYDMGVSVDDVDVPQEVYMAMLRAGYEVGDAI